MLVQKAQAVEESPPGEFVNEELERDCARFLDDVRRRALRSEGFGASSEK